MFSKRSGQQWSFSFGNSRQVNNGSVNIATYTFYAKSAVSNPVITIQPEFYSITGTPSAYFHIEDVKIYTGDQTIQQTTSAQTVSINSAPSLNVITNSLVDYLENPANTYNEIEVDNVDCHHALKVANYATSGTYFNPNLITHTGTFEIDLTNFRGCTGGGGFYLIFVYVARNTGFYLSGSFVSTTSTNIVATTTFNSNGITMGLSGSKILITNNVGSNQWFKCTVLGVCGIPAG
jgi:hypothetical protein